MTNTFAQCIADRLVSMDTTADKLAETLGYKRSTIIGMWLRGEFIPDQALLPGIAKALDVDLVDLALKWLAAALPEHSEVFEDASYTRPDLIAVSRGGQ